MKLKTNNIIKLIEKYYLDDTTQPVTWKFNNDNIFIKFISKNSDMVGEVTLTCDTQTIKSISIFDSAQLLKLIKIFKNNDIDVSIENNNLYINDNVYDIKFKLADNTLIPKCPDVMVPESFDISFELLDTNIKNIISAYNTLKEDTVKFSLDNSLEHGDMCKITFGNTSEYSNKISYSVKSNLNIDFSLDYCVDFNSEMFCNILSNNMDSNIFVNITNEGLMYISCKNESFTTNYFVLKKSEI